jgi:integrase
MFNKAIEWGFNGENPAQYIKKYKEISRDRYLQPNEIQRFFISVQQEPNITLKNYFYLLLFTGARKTNLLSMKWQEIDFSMNEWRIPDTKNGEPQKVPLMQEAIDSLNEIKDYQKTSNINTDYVFYSPASKSKHLEEPKSAWKRILERANIQNLRIHDIRRTNGSYQAMTGSSLLIIGKSLAHKSTQSTEVYARMNNDPVRDSVRKAMDKILEYKDM